MGPDGSSPVSSVVVPTRGDSARLRAALESVRATADIEIVLVHDRRDGESPLPDTFGRHVRIVESPQPGPAAARNAGLEAAGGRFAAFLDDDDLWLPGHLDRACRTLHAEPSALLVACDAYRMDDATPDGSASPPEDPRTLRRLGMRSGSGEITRRELLLGNPILTPTVVLDRKRLDVSDRFRTELPVMEDYDLWLRLSARHRLLFDDEARVIVRKRAGSASGDHRAIAWNSLVILEPLLHGSGRPLLAPAEVNRRLGGLWHDLAWALLAEDDPAAARQALRRSLAHLPLRLKSYIYVVASVFPGPMRRALFAGGRGLR